MPVPSGAGVGVVVAEGVGELVGVADGGGAVAVPVADAVGVLLGVVTPVCCGAGSKPRHAALASPAIRASTLTLVASVMLSCATQ